MGRPATGLALRDESCAIPHSDPTSVTPTKRCTPNASRDKGAFHLTVNNKHDGLSADVARYPSAS